MTSDNSVVTLSIVNGPTGASIVGNASVPAVNGVAMFPGLFVNLPGTYVFGAVDGTLPPTQTLPIAVNTLPSSTITFPTASSYTPDSWTGSITGTASVGVGTLASVGVYIFDGTNYWNGADGAFDSSGPISNAATLAQSNWSYAFPAADLTNGKTYTVQSQAEDSLGNLETLTAGMTFTFTVPVPTVSAISPSFGVGGAPQGPAGAGTVVTITGTNLDDATAVSFGGLPAQFTIDSATQIQATAPLGGAVLVDIVVTNGGGSSAKSSADQFSFVSATITNGQQGSFVGLGPTLTPVANLPALPAGVTGEFPDAIGFTVGGVGLGGKVTVIIQLPAGTLQPGITYSYEKFNSTTNTWTTFVTDNGNSASFDLAAQQIDLTLTDGGADDQDGATNNSITDPGLPVINPNAAPPIAKYALTQLGSFPTGPGFANSMGLAQDTQGDLFAAITTGGMTSLDANNNTIPDGSIVEEVQGSFTINVLAQFNGANGAEPIYGVTFDKAGNLYGVTFSGGANLLGTIWELPAGGSSILALASFPAPVNGIGGIKPTGGLVVDGQGNLFGLGSGGMLPTGQPGDGVIYELPIGSSQIQVLAVFNGVDGSAPGGTLLDVNGALIGAAAGGANGLGTIFEFNDRGLQTLANFTSSDQSLGLPSGGLTQDQAGNFYGVAQNGVYEVPAGSSAVMSLARLINLSDTNDARGVPPLAVDAFGDVFGVTDDGGTFNQGAAYEIQAGSGKAVIIGSLGGLDRSGSTIPALPDSGLVMDASGNLFGMTEDGGQAGVNGDGFFFELSPSGATQLGFGRLPTAPLATQPFNPSITVQVQNSAGNVVTSDASTVTLGIQSGPSGAALFGNVQQSAQNGVATFSGVGATLPGTYILRATDGTLTVGESVPFFVAAQLSSTVTFPSDPAYTPATWTGTITGTTIIDAGANVTGVGVSIFDGANYWNAADAAFDSANPVFNTATLAQGTWSFAFPAANLTNGKTYLVQSQATDNLGDVETPSAGKTISFSISSQPVSTITFPSAPAYTPATWTGSITGTASVGAGATITGVGVSIFDGSNYWNSSDSAFDSATPVFNVVTLGQATWSFAFPAANLINGKTYTVQSQATDNFSDVETPSAGKTISFSVPAPTVTGITPIFGTGGSSQGATGQGASGTLVTITGTSFVGTQEVLFGNLTAQFSVVSDTQIQAIAPAGGLGTVDIVVGNSVGVSAKSSADQFSFVTATITAGAQGATLTVGPTLIPLPTLRALPAGLTPLLEDAVGFTVSNVGAGGTVTVTVQLPKGSLQLAANAGVTLGYFKFNATTQSWSPFVTDAHDSVQFDVPDDQVELTLTDGGPDDQDGAVDGQIVDPGVPVIVATGTPPSFVNSAAATFIVGTKSSFTVSATGTPPVTLSETGQLPTGVSFDDATGMLEGTPAAGSQGNYSITLTASNGVGSPVTQSFALTVLTPNEAYVSAVFQDVLGRRVDPVGLQFFSGLIDHGSTHSAVVSLVNHSAEYFGKIIESTFNQFLGRGAESAAVSFWSTQMADGLTDAQFAASVLGSPEAFTHNGANDKQLLDAFYLTLLDRSGEPSGEDFWLEQLNAGSSNGAVALAFTTSAEFDKDQASTDYTMLLHRLPSADELASALTLLQKGGTQEELVAQITSTSEYIDNIPNRGDL